MPSRPTLARRPCLETSSGHREGTPPSQPSTGFKHCSRTPADIPSSSHVVQPADRIVETLAIPPLARAGSAVTALPVPLLEPLVDDSTAGFALVRVDGSGAVASKAAITLLGWSAGIPIRYDLRSGLIVVTADPNAGRRVPAKLNLVLPTKIRSRCRVRAGDQVFLAALLEHKLLVIYPQRRLYDMVLAYHATLRTEPGSLP
ncbi:hypothetical protein OG738_28985 [Amycolatopsis sp. NBC_01488]|uniref:hypothetical protein n=1 Tax=Amycolatopsis sp. NBC_01488 TaxID=2903563 RepID=UPI002E2975F0|nr:hypothetical protein [Amycolatopsis sp. NBC_01488]